MSDKDTIYRQDAIDAVNAYLGLSAVSRTIQNMTSIQEILENLPSAEPRKKGEWINHVKADKCSESPSGWIPCSERLPEEDNVEVLCTVKQQSKTDRSETIIVEQGCYFYGTWLLSYDNQRINCSREVLAWQPLPEPYQPKEDES